MIFYEIFKKYFGSKITVNFKNGMSMEGVIDNVDGFLNIRLKSATFLEQSPLKNMSECFIRGNTIKYISFSKDLDRDLIVDACRLKHIIDDKKCN